MKTAGVLPAGVGGVDLLSLAGADQGRANAIDRRVGRRGGSGGAVPRAAER